MLLFPVDSMSGAGEGVSAERSRDPVAMREHLRHVEEDVLIPKKMRAKAMVLCADYVKGAWGRACFANVYPEPDRDCGVSLMSDLSTFLVSSEIKGPAICCSF